MNNIYIYITLTVLLIIILLQIYLTLNDNENYIRNQYNINKKVSKYFSLLYNANLNKTVDDLFKLKVLYQDKLKKANIEYKLIKRPNCPYRNNDFYECMTCCYECAFDSSGLIWNYKIKRYDAIPDNTMVEVTHCSSGSTPTEEISAAWFYNTPGSNIWFNIGKTISFKDHRDAIVYFLGNDYLDKFKDCKHRHSLDCQKHFNDLFTKIKTTTNYDTVQFLDRRDMRCALKGDNQTGAIEIVNVRSNGSSPFPTNIDFMTMYNGKFINCDKVTVSSMATGGETGKCLQCKNNISI